MVKKKKFIVEDHHDDCGEDLSSLIGHTLEEENGDSKFISSTECESDQVHEEELAAEPGYPSSYPINE